MKDQGDRISGFCASNSGEIRNCYALQPPGIRSKNGSFVSENTGKILTSLYTRKGQVVDLFGENGTLTHRELRSEKDASDAGFDTTDIWDYTGSESVLRFSDDKWLDRSDPPGNFRRLGISTEKELRDFTDRVNSGGIDTRSLYVELLSDIDCKGKRLNPIGSSRKYAFCGVFEGNGHTIRNFRIVGRQTESWGFFGYLRGAARNLSLDCVIRGEGIVGAFCGNNEGSVTCCGAVGEVDVRGYDLRCGGFAGVNSGKIDRCYCAMAVQKAAAPLIPILMAAFIALLIGIVSTMFLPSLDDADGIYAPIESDKRQIKVSDAGEPPSEGNSISFEFDETLHIDPETGFCFINFTNPSNDRNKLIIRLEADNEERTLLSETGAVDPGYSLQYLVLNDAGFEQINNGLRSAYIVLTAYDSETNDKAMVDTELPVRISID